MLMGCSWDARDSFWDLQTILPISFFSHLRSRDSFRGFLGDSREIVEDSPISLRGGGGNSFQFFKGFFGILPAPFGHDPQVLDFQRILEDS